MTEHLETDVTRLLSPTRDESSPSSCRPDVSVSHLKVVLEADQEREVDGLQDPLLVQRVLHLLQPHHL